MVGEERIFSNSYNSIKNAFARMFPKLTCGLTISGSPELGIKCNLFEMDLRDSETWLVLILGLEIGKLRLLFIKKESVKDNILRESGEPDSVKVRRKFVNFNSKEAFGETLCLENIMDSKDTFQIPNSSENKDSNNYFMNTEFTPNEQPKAIETFKEEMIQGLGGVQHWKKYRYRLENNLSQAEEKGLNDNKLRLGSYMLDEQNKDDTKQQHFRNKSEQIEDNPNPNAKNTQFFIDLEVPTEIFHVLFKEFDFKEDPQINFDEHQQIPKVFTWDQSVVDCYMDIETKEVFRKKQFESRLKRLKSQFDNQRRASRVNDLHKSTMICRSKTEPLEHTKFPFQRKNTGGGTRGSMHQSIEDVSARLRKKDQDFEIFLLANGVRHFGLKQTLEWASQVLSQFWSSPDEKELEADFDIATGTLKMNLLDSSLVIKTKQSIYLCSIEKSFNLKRRPDFAAIENFLKGELLEKGSVCELFLMNLILERTDTILKGKPKSLVLPKLKKGFNEFIYVYSRTIKTYKLDKWLDKMKRKKKSVMKQTEKRNLMNTSINAYMESLPQVTFLLGNSNMQCTLEANEFDLNNFMGMIGNQPGKNISEETEDESMTFTIREIVIEFNKPRKAGGGKPESASNPKGISESLLEHQYKIFVVSVPDFENMNKSDKMVLFVDLQHFNVGNCKHQRLASGLITSDNLKMTIPKIGMDFTNQDTSNLKICSHAILNQPKIKEQPITVESSNEVFFRKSSFDQNSKTSLANKMNSLSKTSSKDIEPNSDVSIAKSFSPLTTLDLDSKTEGYMIKTKLTIQSGLSPPFIKDGVKQENFFNSQKIQQLDWRTSIMRTQDVGSGSCGCSAKIEEEDFYKLFRKNIYNDVLASLLFVLVKSNISLFKLDSTLFN